MSRVLPAGALSDEGQWKPVKGNYLFPVKALSRRFRGNMVSALRQSANAGELKRVTHPGEIDRLLDELMGTEWVVYTKHCLSHTESVVEYLGRYSHRIAITNARILRVDEQGVFIRYNKLTGDTHNLPHNHACRNPATLTAKAQYAFMTLVFV